MNFFFILSRLDKIVDDRAFVDKTHAFCTTVSAGLGDLSSRIPVNISWMEGTLISRWLPFLLALVAILLSEITSEAVSVSVRYLKNAQWTHYTTLLPHSIMSSSPCTLATHTSCVMMHTSPSMLFACHLFSKLCLLFTWKYFFLLQSIQTQPANLG